jgi:uncharacterized surface protein with fasciclin (FAS1) repeats
LFAPTDDAFLQLSNQQPRVFQAIFSDMQVLRQVVSFHKRFLFSIANLLPLFLIFQVLLFHISTELAYVGEIPFGASSLPTLLGSQVNLLNNGTITVNGASIQSNNKIAKNGVIQVIDKVLLPPGFVPTLRTVMQGSYFHFLCRFIIPLSSTQLDENDCHNGFLWTWCRNP